MKDSQRILYLVANRKRTAKKKAAQSAEAAVDDDSEDSEKEVDEAKEAKKVFAIFLRYVPLLYCTHCIFPSTRTMTIPKKIRLAKPERCRMTIFPFTFCHG